MGAVIFWVAVGLANAKALDGSLQSDPNKAMVAVSESSADWPVAKAPAFDIQSGNP